MSREMKMEMEEWEETRKQIGCNIHQQQQGADGVPGRARVVAMLTRSSYLGKLMAALARIYTRRLAWASCESQSRVYGAVKLAIDKKGRCFVYTE